MSHLAHMQTLLPIRSCCLPLFLERMLVQNISHENDLILKRMNVQVTCTFIRIVLHEHSFCHQGKIQVFIHELAQGAFDFFFFPPSVTNRRLVSKAHAYSTWHLQKLSTWKVSTNSMISRAMKSHTNEHTVRGRPTLKDVKRYRNGSVCKPYERSICERTFERIYQESCYTKGAINRRYQLFSLIKSVFRSVIVFLDVIVNQAESQHELKNVWATRAERLENLFTNVSVRVHLSKTLWETS